MNTIRAEQGQEEERLARHAEALAKNVTMPSDAQIHASLTTPR